MRNLIFPRRKAEWQASVDALLAIVGQAELLDGNPVLKRSIRNRFPYPTRSTICRLNCCNGTAAAKATSGCGGRYT